MYTQASPAKSQSSCHRSYPPSRHNTGRHCTPRLSPRPEHHRMPVTELHQLRHLTLILLPPARTLPLSYASIAARSSRSRSIRFAMRVNSAPRSTAGTPLQSPSNAALAAATALSTSCSEAASTCTIDLPVLVNLRLTLSWSWPVWVRTYFGSSTSIFELAEPETNSLLMKRPVG